MKNIELTKSVIGLLSCYNYLDPLIDLATRTTTCPTTWNLPGPLSQRYISSQRCIPNNVTFKKRQKPSAFYDRCQPSAGPGNK